MFVELGAGLSACVHHPNADMRAAAFTKLGETLLTQHKVIHYLFLVCGRNKVQGPGSMLFNVFLCCYVYRERRIW